MTMQTLRPRSALTRALRTGEERNAFMGFFERQRNLYKRYWLWEAAWFCYSLVSVLSIGYLASGLSALGLDSARADVRRTLLYLLVGSILWGYLSLVFFEVAFAIAWERWEGTIEYTFMAPVRRLTHLLGVCLFAVIYGLARTALVVIAVGFSFHLDLSRADPAGALLVLAVSTIPVVGLGILTSTLPLLSPEKGEQMTVAVQGVLLLISGVYYPVSVLPGPLRLAGALSPLTYTLSGMRAALLDHAGPVKLAPTLGVLLLMGVVLIPGSTWVFSRAEARAKRLGLLKRNG
ncbi:MAG: ABC transporter permease [Candidatus Dormibacteraeota bacterium]|nr:ABC transporter permease [Candidatus Dormibacteraeota bacterium]